MDLVLVPADADEDGQVNHRQNQADDQSSLMLNDLVDVFNKMPADVVRIVLRGRFLHCVVHY